MNTIISFFRGALSTKKSPMGGFRGLAFRGLSSYQATRHHAPDIHNVANDVVNNGHLFVGNGTGANSITPTKILIGMQNKQFIKDSSLHYVAFGMTPQFMERKVCEAAAKPPLHTPPSSCETPVIPTEARNLINYRLFIFRTITTQSKNIGVSGKQGSCRNAISLYPSIACAMSSRAYGNLLHNVLSTACLTYPSTPQQLYQQDGRSRHIQYPVRNLHPVFAHQIPYQNIFLTKINNNLSSS